MRKTAKVIILMVLALTISVVIPQFVGGCDEPAGSMSNPCSG